MALSIAALGCFAPSFANAQHIVTESEAGKLTLASLTAVPVVHHSHRYRSNKSRRVFTRPVSYQSRSSRGYKSLVHRVSYNHKTFRAMKVKNAVYRMSGRKKIRLRQHRS